MSMQAARATFTGTQAFVDVLLDQRFPSMDVLASGLVCTTLAGVTYTVTILSENRVRVTPSSTFTGYVDLLVVEV